MMTKWPIIQISELVDRNEINLQTGPFGTQLKASDYVEEGVPVINVRNIGFGDIREADLEYLDEKIVDKLHVHQLQAGDIVFGRKGAVERHALISNNETGWVQGSDCLRIRNNEKTLCSRFISYYFRTVGHKSWMEAVCSFGATMSSLNQGIVKRITIPNPNFPTQRKIAAILTAYDDLIETNKRRIALLEKMAEELYREWFVRMRFPGHQNTRFVKGVPVGWAVKPSNQLFDVRSGGTPKTDTPQFWNGSIPFFTPKDAQEHIYVSRTEKWITEKGLNSCNSPLYPKNTIFITARGTVGKLALAQCDMAMNQSCYALVQKFDQEVYFFYLAMLNAITVVKGVSKSGVFDNIIVDTFKIIPMYFPGEALVKAFNDIAHPIFAQIEALLSANSNLTKTRDLLLPRLISGKLSVENLDIQFPLSMQEETPEPESAHAELHL